jgi:hypothetical protein
VNGNLLARKKPLMVRSRFAARHSFCLDQVEFPFLNLARGMRNASASSHRPCRSPLAANQKGRLDLKSAERCNAATNPTTVVSQTSTAHSLRIANAEPTSAKLKRLLDLDFNTLFHGIACSQQQGFLIHLPCNILVVLNHLRICFRFDFRRRCTAFNPRHRIAVVA